MMSEPRSEQRACRTCGLLRERKAFGPRHGGIVRAPTRFIMQMVEVVRAVLQKTKRDIPTYQLPGPIGAQVVATEQRLDTTGTKTAPIVVKHARGLIVEDVDGNVFLDFTSGMVTATGHCHPDVVKAIQDQS